MDLAAYLDGLAALTAAIIFAAIAIGAMLLRTEQG